MGPLRPEINWPLPAGHQPFPSGGLGRKACGALEDIVEPSALRVRARAAGALEAVCAARERHGADAVALQMAEAALLRLEQS